MLIIIGFQGQVIQRKLCLLYLVLMDVTKLDRDLVFVLFFCDGSKNRGFINLAFKGNCLLRTLKFQSVFFITVICMMSSHYTFFLKVNQCWKMKRPSEKYKIASMFINSLQEEILGWRDCANVTMVTIMARTRVLFYVERCQRGKKGKEAGSQLSYVF